jgi:hypothetical protein
MGGTTKKIGDYGHNLIKDPLGTVASGGIAGSLMPKAQEVKGFEMPQNLVKAEQQMLARQAGIAAGTVPSIAQQQLAQANDQQARQAMSMAASQRGASNPALAFRQAQVGSQQMGLENAQAGAIMGEQERRQADMLIGQQAASARGYAFNQANQNQIAKSNQQNQLMNAVVGAGTTAAMLSDETEKENIKPAKGSANEIETFMNAIKEYNYNYKNKANGTGEKTGVMAQDLEKTAVGKTMVDENGSGQKVVDTNKAIGAILAGMSDLNKKIKKMEK